MHIIIIPGLDGSDDRHWQSRWESGWLPARPGSRRRPGPIPTWGTGLPRSTAPYVAGQTTTSS
jgi:hypothetical protein